MDSCFWSFVCWSRNRDATKRQLWYAVTSDSSWEGQCRRKECCSCFSVCDSCVTERSKQDDCGSSTNASLRTEQAQLINTYLELRLKRAKKRFEFAAVICQDVILCNILKSYTGKVNYTESKYVLNKELFCCRAPTDRLTPEPPLVPPPSASTYWLWLL